MSTLLTPDLARGWFERAARGVVALTTYIDPGHLDIPALGEWTVRDLLGHTSRSFLTIETYLDAAPASGSPNLAGPGEYYIATRHALHTDQNAIAQRGRDAGAALGDDPLGRFAHIADRVLRLVAESPDDAPVTTPFGSMTLGDYLPTRAFELTVHGLDLAAAIGMPPGHDLLATATPALHLAVDVAAADDRAVLLLGSLTGRAVLPEEFSIL